MKRFTGWVLQRVLLAGLLAAASSTRIAKPSLAVGDVVVSDTGMIFATPEVLNGFQAAGNHGIGAIDLQVPKTDDQMQYAGGLIFEPKTLRYRILAIVHWNGKTLAFVRTLAKGTNRDDHTGWNWLAVYRKP